MKTFLLNLDRCTERLEHMRQVLAALNFPYERVSAICGAELSEEELARFFDADRSLAANRSRMTVGEIGCALSHDLIYQRMMEEGIECALVLEDDIDISPEFPRALECVRKSLDVTRPQVFLFSYFRNQNSFESSAPVSTFEIVRMKSMACTDAYVITLPAAELIYHANYPVMTCSDQFRRWHRHFGLELYRCLPATVRQNPVFGSEIGKRQTGASGFKRLWYTIKDAYGLWRDGR